MMLHRQGQGQSEEEQTHGARQSKRFCMTQEYAASAPSCRGPMRMGWWFPALAAKTKNAARMATAIDILYPTLTNSQERELAKVGQPGAFEFR